MGTNPVGLRSPQSYLSNANSSALQGEVVATTPLGRDADGKNLVAYIVRTEDEAPRFTPPKQANTNQANNQSNNLNNFIQAGQAKENSEKDKSKAAENFQNSFAQNKLAKNNPTSALFIKPDQLLTRQEQAQLNQLRERDAEIKNDDTVLDDGDGNELLTAPIYATGPDGRRYVLGSGPPLLAGTAGNKNQNSGLNSAYSNAFPLQGGAENIYVKAAISYRHTSYNDYQGYSGGLIDRAL
jgi:hypothetical protein